MQFYLTNLVFFDYSRVIFGIWFGSTFTVKMPFLLVCVLSEVIKPRVCTLL